MVLTVTEDTPADMLAGSMELLVQLPVDHHVPTQRVTVERSTAMMDLLVQIATSHKLAASSYTLQAIGERGLVLPHQPNTPIGALDALQVKLLPKQGTFIPRKSKQPNQPFETTFRLQVHLPRNQLYVSRVSPKMNLGEILGEVCREKNLDRNKYELRHPGNHEEILDLSLSLQDYHLQEVTLYAKQGQTLGSALSSQDIMALQRQEERRRQHAKQSVFGFMFRKSKETSLSTDSLGERSVSPSHSDETGRSVSPLAPTRPQRKRRPAPNPPKQNEEKLVISHSRNSSDSSGYHEASVLSDNPDSSGRMPETLPRRSKAPGKFETRKLAHTSQTSKSLSNLAVTSTLSHATSNTSLSSTGVRKKRAAPQPPISRPLSSAISTLALERIVDSEESLTSDMGISKSPSDIEANSKANSDIAVGVKGTDDFYDKSEDMKRKLDERNVSIDELSSENRNYEQVDAPKCVEPARVGKRDKEETEILLQKVSTTLATVLPSPEVEAPLEKPEKIQEEADSTPNQTINSQQDTSDYVSATGDDLSGTDWEYQLPDPPSAFRDSSPDASGYETITLGSVEAFKDPIVLTESSEAPKESPKSQNPSSDSKPEVKPLQSIPDVVKTQKIESPRQTLDLKKNIISELEGKIENGEFPVNNKLQDDAKRIINKSTPKIAPVDNTLSNFTITTYGRDKSVNIYDNSNGNVFPSSDERIVKTFATLARSRSSIPHKEYFPKANDVKNNGKLENRAQSVQNIDSQDEEPKKSGFKGIERPQDQKSSIVHRSKSYIVLSNNSKYREEKRPLPDVVDASRMYKSTSYTNLNQENGKNDELQSVQVLKSILPQLKNAQLSSELEEKKGNDKKIIENKTYKYTGPPAISLGSWSERPCVNVQIKHDTDYKFGVKNNQSGGKTVVNLNSTSNDVEIINYGDSITKTLPKTSKIDNSRGIFKNQLKKNHENEEKINGIKNKISSNYVKFHTLSGDDDKPVITDVSLKKTDDDVKIDTRPVNFRELTQAFGQVNLRNKRLNSSQNRHSDYFDSRHDNEEKNEVIKSTNGQVIKRYTSVIGIHSNNGFDKVRKINGPVVKGFKRNEAQSEINSVNSIQNKFKVPTPPTMPVITGVTLKNNSVRPKSMAVCQDPRDQLLESIRNFGKNKLKSVSTFS